LTRFPDARHVIGSTGLDRDPSTPQIIRTERAVAYVFALAVEAL
jgi:hypothetical protein